MGFYKEGKNWKVQVYYKDWQGNQKENRKEDSGPKVKLGNGKENFLQQQSQGVDIEFGNFLEIITKIWMSVSEKTLCTRSGILLT